MANKPLLYIGAGILFLIGVCLLGYGALSLLVPHPHNGSQNWLT